jgi:hypothetical protein
VSRKDKNKGSKKQAGMRALEQKSDTIVFEMMINKKRRNVF